MYGTCECNVHAYTYAKYNGARNEEMTIKTCKLHADPGSQKGGGAHSQQGRGHTANKGGAHSQQRRGTQPKWEGHTSNKGGAHIQQGRGAHSQQGRGTQPKWEGHTANKGGAHSQQGRGTQPTREGYTAKMGGAHSQQGKGTQPGLLKKGRHPFATITNFTSSNIFSN